MYDRLEQLCAVLCADCSQCKSACSSKDHCICIELCSRMCQCCVNCINSDETHAKELLCSLNKVCQWTYQNCHKMVGCQRSECKKFLESCQQCIDACQMLGCDRYRASSFVASDTDVYKISLACRKFMAACCTEKGKCMKAGNRSGDDMMAIECACQCVDIVCEMSCNAPETLDHHLLQHVSYLCQRCKACSFCATEAEGVLNACSITATSLSVQSEAVAPPANLAVYAYEEADEYETTNKATMTSEEKINAVLRALFTQGNSDCVRS